MYYNLLLNLILILFLFKSLELLKTNLIIQIRNLLYISIIYKLSQNSIPNINHKYYYIFQKPFNL